MYTDHKWYSEKWGTCPALILFRQRNKIFENLTGQRNLGLDSSFVRVSKQRELR